MPTLDTIGASTYQSPETPLIGGDPIPPKKPLKSLNDKLKREKDLDTATPDIMRLTMTPGYIEQGNRMLSDHLAELKQSGADRAQEIIASQPHFDKITEEVFGKDGVNLGKYTMKNPGGNTEIDDRIFIPALSKINEREGGGAYSQSLLAAYVKAQGLKRIYNNEATWEADKLSRENKINIKSEGDIKNELGSMAAETQATFDSLKNTVNKQVKNEIAPIAQERDAFLGEVYGDYELKRNRIRQNIIGNKISENANDIYQHSADVDQQIKDGIVSSEDGKKMKEEFIKQSDAQIEQFVNSRDLRHATNGEYNKLYGGQMEKEIGEVSGKYSKVIKSKLDKGQSQLRRMADEQNVLLRKKSEALISKTQSENNEVLTKLWNDASSIARKKRLERDQTHRNVTDVMATVPGMTSLKLGQLLGSAPMVSIGTFAQGLGDFLSANGIAGAIPDWLKGEGGHLQVNNSIARAELDLDNFFTPLFLAKLSGNLAQIGGSAAGYMAPMALTSMVAGPEAGAVVSAVGNGLFMGGDAYYKMIENGVPPAEAYKRMNSFILKDIALSFIPDMLTARMFSRSVKGFALRTMDLAVSAGGQAAQEMVENPLEEIHINPEKNFLSEFATKQNLEAGMEAGLGTIMMGVAAPAGSTLLTRSLKESNVPGVPAQWTAQLIMKGGVDRAKAAAQLDLHDNIITEQEYNNRVEDIHAIDAKVKDAKVFGLSKAQTLSYIGYSSEADQLKKISAEISDPEMKKATEEKALMMQKEANNVLNGTTKVGNINIGGLGSIAAKESDAKSINEKMDAHDGETMPPPKQEVDMNDSEFEVLSAIHQNQENLQGSYGEAIRDRINDPENYKDIVDSVASQVMDDPKAALDTFGVEVVDAVLKLTQPNNESTQNATSDNGRLSNQVSQTQQKGTAESAKISEEITGQTPGAKTNGISGSTGDGNIQQMDDRGRGAASQPNSAIGKVKERFVNHVLDDIENGPSDNSMELRIDIPGMTHAVRLKAVKDMRAGKDTKPVQQLKAAIESMFEAGEVPYNGGRGNHTRRAGVSVEDFIMTAEGDMTSGVSLTKDEITHSNTIPDDIQSLFEEEGITSKNITKLGSAVIDGVPVTENELNDVKEQLEAQEQAGDNAAIQGNDNQEQAAQSESGGIDQQAESRKARAEFLAKVKSDFTAFTNTKPENKGKKLAGIASRLKAARDEGLISKDEAIDLNERIDKAYQHIGETRPVPVPEGIPLADLIKDNKPTSKEAAKNIADQVRGLKSKGNKAYGGFLGVGVAVYDGMLETIATAIEAGGSIVDALKQAVDYITKNVQADKYTPDDIQEAVEAQFVKIGLMPPTQDSKQAKAAINAFRKETKTQIKTERDAGKIIKGLQERVFQYFKENGINVTKGRAASIIKSLQKLNDLKYPEEALLDVIDNIDDVISQQQLQNDKQSVEAQVKKFLGMVRGKSSVMSSSYRTFFKSLNFPTPAAIVRILGKKGLEDYATVMQLMLDGYNNKQDERVLNKTWIAGLFNRLNEELAKGQQKQLENRVESLVDLKALPEGTTVEQYLNDKDVDLSPAELTDEQKAKNEKQAKKDENLKAYRDIVKLRQEDLKAEIESIEHTDDKKDAAELADLDLSEMNIKELGKVMDILNNAIKDKDFTDFHAPLIARDVKDRNSALSSLFKKIKIRAVGKILGTSLSRIQGLTNLFTSITFNPEDAAFVRNKVIGSFERGNNKAQSRMVGTKRAPGVRDQFLDVIKQNKIDAKSEDRLWAYSFLNQAEEKNGRTRDEHFDEMLDKLIKSSVEKLSVKGARKSDSVRKWGMLEQAKRTAEALKSLGLIEDFEIIPEKPTLTNPIYPLIEKMGKITVTRKESVDTNIKLSENEQAVYDFVQEKYADIVDAHERVARKTYGLDFQRIINYFPRIARAFDPTKAGLDTDADRMEIHGELPKKLSSQPMDRMKKRGELAGDDKYYEIGFTDTFLNSYHQVLQSIEAGRALKTSVKTINSAAFGEFIYGNEKADPGGKDNNENVRIFREQMKDYITDMKQAPFLFDTVTSFANKIIKSSISHMIKTYLNSTTQFVKQYASNFVATMIKTGPLATRRALGLQIWSMMDKSLNIQYNEFLSNFSGTSRVPMNMEAFDRQLRTNPPWRKAKYTYDLIGKPGEYALKTADKGAFNLSVLSAYVDYMVKHDYLKSASDFNLEDAIANMNSEAISYAEQVAGSINNDSSKPARAKVIKNKEGNIMLTQYMLQGFSLAAYVEAHNNFRTAFMSGGRASHSDKMVAYKSLTSYIAQIAVFNLTKLYLLDQFKGLVTDSVMPLIYGLLPHEDDDEDEKERKAKTLTKAGWAVVADATMSGLPAFLQPVAKEGVNQLALQANKFRDEDNQIEEPYYTGGTHWPGSGDILTRMSLTAWNGVVHREDDHLTEEQNSALNTNDKAKLIAFIFKSGDLWELSNSMEKSIKKAQQ